MSYAMPGIIPDPALRAKNYFLIAFSDAVMESMNA